MEELAKRFADLAEKFGPRVADAAVAAARVEAWSTLVQSCFGVLVGGIGVYLCWRWGKWQISTRNEELVVLPALAAFGAGVLVLLGISCLIDPWLWTAFSHPDIWLARRALGL